MPSRKLSRSLTMLHCAAVLIFSAQAVPASNIGVDLNIRLGGEPRQVVLPEPVHAPMPAPSLAVEEDIAFIYPEQLGFYVAVGVPYDLFYLDDGYFVFRDGRWLRAPGSRGPWMVQRYRDLPPTLRRHRLERIREYRNSEYRVYKRDRAQYRGRPFRSDRVHWNDQGREIKSAPRHELRRDDKELRRDDKELRRDEKRVEKEQRREEKRLDKEERREHRGGRE